MAIPPEPIQELIDASTDIVDAEVAEVVSTGTKPAQPDVPTGTTSAGFKAAEQVVVLKVARALKGGAKGNLTVHKPVSGYALKAGNKGAFFLRAGQPHAEILGRYGPDTYRVESVEHVLGKK
ncbi:MAG: hypothetical protein HY904_01780 [Deltaproteobacteria bacterium]|nr:hypothetical protein [Deltaproteobacteria bacterium]